jgi:NitT/TauT family transport system substrate-binding protein
MSHRASRRSFLGGLLVSTAGIANIDLVKAEDAPPDVKTVRFAQATGICIAPQFVAEELIRAEGVLNFESVVADGGLPQTEMLAKGAVDFGIDFATAYVIPIDAGAPIKVISGVHVGCYELFAREDIKSVLDLKGKSVGVGLNLNSDAHIFMGAMASHVGLDPLKDIRWVMGEEKPLELFEAGKIDAFLAFPPEAQMLRARKVGHVVVNSTIDRPWSQYFCCMLAVNADFAERNPAATKRVLRNILKANDICVSEPQRVARLLVDGGYTKDYDPALQALREYPYAQWRDFDPEDTIRFFALRLREADLVKSSPQDIIAAGTDWRFFNEVKRELKT